MELAKIREDLKNIRYYFARKDMFDRVSISVGENSILEKINTYNSIVRNAPPRLYDIYVSLYLENNTQESLSDKLGYTIEYISKLNSQLVKFFQKSFDKEGKDFL